MLLTWTQPPTGPRLEVTGAKSSFVMLWNSHGAADSARIKEPSSASIRWVDATSTITVHGELFQKRTIGHPHSKQPHRNNDTKISQTCCEDERAYHNAWHRAEAWILRVWLLDVQSITLGQRKLELTTYSVPGPTLGWRWTSENQLNVVWHLLVMKLQWNGEGSEVKNNNSHLK